MDNLGRELEWAMVAALLGAVVLGVSIGAGLVLLTRRFLGWP